MSISLRYALRRKEFDLDVEFAIPLRGIIGLFGESGAGKTTLLHCIAGLERPEAGCLTVHDEVWESQSENISRNVQARDIGYVFQEPRLFPHLTVRRNLDYGRRRSEAPANDAEFDRIVSLLALEALLHRKPDALSGGEAQRVAIARALLRAPKIVLMDEPLASLDRARKEEILPFLDRLHAELSLPIIYVSHSIEEVCRLCDHLIVLERGKVLANEELQSALLRMDLPILAGDEAGAVVRGRIKFCDTAYELTTFEFSGGEMLLPGIVADVGQSIRLRIRASDISLSRERPLQSTILNVLTATIDEIQEGQGPSVLIRLATGTDHLLARVTRRSCDELNLQSGDKVHAQIKAVAVRSAGAS